MVRAVERGMLRRTEEEITYLSIDEKSSHRGHTYASILTEIDRLRVLDLVPEKKLVAAVSLLETLNSGATYIGQGGGHGYVAGVYQCSQTMHVAGGHRA